MFAIDLKSKKSIYEQIVDGLKGEIVSKSLGPDEKIPSVREMAEKLTVNPNTIQKAYRDLEMGGWIYSVSGRGNFVSSELPGMDSKHIESLYADISSAVRELTFSGESREELKKRINNIIESEGNSK